MVCFALEQSHLLRQMCHLCFQFIDDGAITFLIAQSSYQSFESIETSGDELSHGCHDFLQMRLTYKRIPATVQCTRGSVLGAASLAAPLPSKNRLVARVFFAEAENTQFRLGYKP